MRFMKLVFSLIVLFNTSNTQLQGDLEQQVHHTISCSRYADWT